MALVLLPLAVSASALVFDVGTSYIAGSDQGLIELRTSDVGGHAVLVGPYARDGWNHPGPALFYALAVPYRLAGSHSIGLGLGALLINGLAISGIAIVARRRGGVPLVLLTLVGCAVLMRSLGAAAGPPRCCVLGHKRPRGPGEHREPPSGPPGGVRERHTRLRRLQAPAVFTPPRSRSRSVHDVDIPGATKIDLNPYLAPGYQYTEYLTFPEGVLKVRNDLVHLSDLGASISGYVIAAAIAPEWT